MDTSTAQNSSSSPSRRALQERWTRLAAPVTAISAGAYAITAGIHVALGNAYPFGTGIPPAPGVLTASWPWQSGAAAAIGAAVLAAALALALWVRRRPGPLLAGATVAFAAVYLVVFFGVVADAMMLSFLGYLPVILVNLVTDPAWVLDRGVPWPAVVNQFVLLAGGLLWTALAAATVRARRDGGSGHRPGAPAGLGAARALRWGTVATWTAVAIPALYAVTRVAWVLGIPLGVDPSFIDGLRGSGDLLSPLGLGGMALLGAVLTWGLVAPWGERIPAWVPWAGGRRVPIAAAVVPALAVAAVVFPAGLQLTVMGLGLASGVPPMLTGDDWGAYGPTLLWPLWSVALAAAAMAYWMRRTAEQGAARASA